MKKKLVSFVQKAFIILTIGCVSSSCVLSRSSAGLGRSCKYGIVGVPVSLTPIPVSKQNAGSMHICGLSDVLHLNKKILVVYRKCVFDTNINELGYGLYDTERQELISGGVLFSPLRVQQPEECSSYEYRHSCESVGSAAEGPYAAGVYSFKDRFVVIARYAREPIYRHDKNGRLRVRTRTNSWYARWIYPDGEIGEPILIPMGELGKSGYANIDFEMKENTIIAYYSRYVDGKIKTERVEMDESFKIINKPSVIAISGYSRVLDVLPLQNGETLLATVSESAKYVCKSSRSLWGKLLGFRPSGSCKEESEGSFLSVYRLDRHGNAINNKPELFKPLYRYIGFGLYKGVSSPFVYIVYPGSKNIVMYEFDKESSDWDKSGRFPEVGDVALLNSKAIYPWWFDNTSSLASVDGVVASDESLYAIWIDRLNDNRYNEIRISRVGCGGSIVKRGNLINKWTKWKK